MIFDLIIIGAGMSGISVGHFFRNKRILLVDRAAPAAEATGKNAGFIISGFGEHFERTIQREGLQRACEIQSIHLSNHRRIQELVQPDIDEYRNSGSLAIAIDDDEEGELLRSCALLRSAGFDVEWIDNAPTGLHQKRRALLNRHDARMNSARFWSRLAADLPISRETVLEITPAGTHLNVRTTQRVYETGIVVYCLNAFSSDLVPELQGKYIPLRGQMIEVPLLRPAPGDLPVFAQHGDVYWRFTNGMLIFGGLEDRVPEEEVGIATTASPRIREEQLAWIRRSFEPGLVAEQPTRSWCSTMAFTVDGYPFVGPLAEPGTYVLAGLCGLGHGYAMECAAWLHELIELKRNPIPAYFSSDRIRNLPSYEGGPWRNLYEAWNH